MKQTLSVLFLWLAIMPSFGQTNVNDTISHPKRCFTIGILEGGGAAVGFDVEHMILNPISAQVGAGFFGDAFDVGLNIHLTKNINSPFLSFQYCLQHHDDFPKRSIIGSSVVYRGLKIFTCQLGYGRFVHSSFFGCNVPEGNPNMVIFAVGVYSPF